MSLIRWFFNKISISTFVKVPYCLPNTSLLSSCIHTNTIDCKYTLERMHERGGPPKRRSRSKMKSPISGFSSMKGVVVKLLIKKPKKPNSGNRKCVLVKLSNGKEMAAYVPGEGHNLQEHSQVKVTGHRKKDLIGVKLRVMRGVLDCASVKKKEQL